MLFVCESGKQGRRGRKEEKIKRLRRQAHLPVPTQGIFIRQAQAAALRTAAQAISGLNSQTNLKEYVNCNEQS